MIKHKRTALVLGSGGARGLAHIGVIKALEENYVPIDIITGTSIGAFIGGLYASGVSIKEMEKIVAEVDKVFVAKILVPKLFAPGLINNKRVVEFIKGMVGDIKIENLKIPFASVATDLITGEEVVFNKGSLADAIMASTAIPTIFQPVKLNNRYLLDGGLSNPLPISVALEMKAQKIIVVNVSPNPKRITGKIKKRKTEEFKSLIKTLPEMFSNMLNNNLRLSARIVNTTKKMDLDETEVYSPTLLNVFLQSIAISTNNLIEQRLLHSKPDVLILPKIEDYDMLEFYKGTEIIKRGYDEAIKSLPKIHELIVKQIANPK